MGVTVNHWLAEFESQMRSQSYKGDAVAHEAGKGSRPRPFSVSQDEYDNRWDAIFGRDLREKEEKVVDTDSEDKYNTNTEAKQ